MLTRALTAAALGVAALLPAPAASATTAIPVCAATSPGEHVHVFCAFVGPPGNYRVEISHQARYGFARATCALGGSVHAGAWDTEGGYASEIGYLAGGPCTLEVAAGAGGPGIGTVYYLAPL